MQHEENGGYKQKVEMKIELLEKQIETL